MKIEVGQRFRSRVLGAETIWIVERLLNTRSPVPHVTIKREDDTQETKTFSEAALQDKTSFELVAEGAE